MFDLKIINGKIVDGTGFPSYKGDIGIIGEKIVEIGDLSSKEAKITINADNKVVSPGFIDMHTHSDMSLVYDRYARSRIYTGVTTDVIGNCGIGVAPVKEENRQLLLDYLGTRIVGSMPVKLELPWDSYKSYIKYMEENPPAVNIAPLLAQGAIRIYEMGFSKEDPTDEQLQNMIDLTEECFKCGALGLTSGLVYLPGEFTSQKELIELNKITKKYGGFYATHMRDEGDDIENAMDEALDVCRQSGVPLEISHLKLSAKQNFGKTDVLFEKIEKAREEGLDVTFDVYPYSSGMTSLSALMPPWTFEGGVDKMIDRIKLPENRDKIIYDIEHGLPGWQNFASIVKSIPKIMIASVIKEENSWMEGKTLEEIGKRLGIDDIYTTIFEILIREKGRVQMVVEGMDEDDVIKILSREDVSVGSDSMSLSHTGLLSKSSTHPRAFGTQSIVLGYYSREKGLFSIESAVRKLTSNPAKRLGLKDRGILKEGYYADIVIFDENKIINKSTYKEPKQYPEGIETVLVNGNIALKDGKQVDILCGKVLKNTYSSGK
ncbi:N-acyl-D-amino-acid deacylase family protein [Intestinibacter sp.]